MLILFCAVLETELSALAWYTSILPLSDILDPLTRQGSGTSFKSQLLYAPVLCGLMS